jgi:hypothetical protein
MALPFPHGSGPGQIANGNNFDNHDTPGYTGGRFIGFGENATSAITNRAAWALSTNIDYIYQKYSSAIAVPQVDAFTSSGASNWHLGTLVFCGDSTYPGTTLSPDLEGLMLLFSVLDDQYNPLTDEHGNEVRVSAVKETTDTSSVYKTGFVQSPWIHFHTVNPKTGAVVVDPYPIPAAQAVRIAYGVASSLETLPVDAFTRYKVMSGEEVPAGVLLLDGSLPMAGDLNLGSHNLLACASISNESYNILLEDTLDGSSVNGLTGIPSIDNGGHTSVIAGDGFSGEASGLYNFGTLALVPPINESDFFGVSWLDVASGSSAYIQLLYSGTGSPTLKFDLYDPVHDLEYAVLLDAVTSSINPGTGAQLDLGLETSPWNHLWANSLNLMSDQMFVDYENVDGSFQIPLLKPSVDYSFMEDFGLSSLYDVSSATLVGNLFIQADADAFINTADILDGRSTVVILGSNASDNQVTLIGPTMQNVDSSILSASIGFDMPALSDPAGEAFEIKAGFNLDGGPVYAYLKITDDLFANLYYSDGVSTTGFAPISIGPDPNLYYDCKIAFGYSQLVLTINGVVTNVIPSFNPAPSAQWSFQPMRLLKTGGSLGSIVYLDYAEMHTEGHVARTV